MGLDCQERGAEWHDHHRNRRGGLCFTRAFGHRMEYARGLKKALSCVHVLNRLTFDPEPRSERATVPDNGLFKRAKK